MPAAGGLLWIGENLTIKSGASPAASSAHCSAQLVGVPLPRIRKMVIPSRSRRAQLRKSRRQWTSEPSAMLEKTRVGTRA